jgi:hypothetical protein
LNLTGIFGLAFVILFFGLMIILAAAGRNRPGRQLRDILAFTRLRRAVGLAVEAGTRLHISVGRGALTGLQSAAAFMGLSMLGRIARAASISDRPPVATSGDGSLSILSQDTLRGAYQTLGAEGQYDPNSGRLVGLTPFSYAVGSIPIIHDEQISANVLIGHFGSEVALINDAAEQSGSLTVGGTDNLPGQAVLYATAQEPLIGEEIFAGGAYLGAGLMHEASLRTQDLLRMLLVIFIIVAAIFRLFGIDGLILDLLAGLLP